MNASGLNFWLKNIKFGQQVTLFECSVLWRTSIFFDSLDVSKNVQDNLLPALVKVINSTLAWISDLKVKSWTKSNLHQASKHEHCTPSTLTDQSLRWRRSRGCVREVERRVPRRRRKFHMPIFAFLWEYPSCMFRWWGKKTGLGNKNKT